MDSASTKEMEDNTVFTRYEVENGSDGVVIPIPLLENVESDEYMSKLFSNGKADICQIEGIRADIKKHVLAETRRLEDERGDELIRKMRASGKCNLRKHSAVSVREETAVKTDAFANKFSHIMHSSSGIHLKMLMDTESAMAKEMAHLTKARAWEVESLAKECDSIIGQSKPTDLQPYQLQQVNDKLKQVYNSYACQISALIDEQRKEYRTFVEKLCKEPGDLPLTDYNEFTISPSSDLHKEVHTDIDESFTVYLGAQLKSMHNVRLVSSPSLIHLCKREPDSKLQLAMNLYSKSLSGLIMLARTDPGWHIKCKTEFATLCEQTTELHFRTLAEQIENVRVTITEATTAKTAEDINKSRDSGRASPVEAPSGTLNVGDVYCTRHSNLQQQVIFHLVVGSDLASSDINSRHPALTGLCHIIRVASRISLTNLYIPLLLIDHPTERTTTAWCLQRAEMVYKCVKGYLMEVCGSFCGGSPNETPHYNIHFVVPAGLSPTIYESLRSLLTTVFHMVPGVTADLCK